MTVKRSGSLFAFFAAIVFALAGCTRMSAVDTLCTESKASTACLLAGASAAPDDAAREYERRLTALTGWNELKRIRLGTGIDINGIEISQYPNLKTQLRYRTAAGAAKPVDGGMIAPLKAARPGIRSYDGRWRNADAYLYLGDHTPVGNHVFRFSGVQAVSTTIFLRSVADKPLHVTGRCDGPAQIETPAGRLRLRAAASFTVNVAPGDRDRARIVVDNRVQGCRLDIRTAGTGSTRSIALEREESTQPAIARMDSRYDVCAMPPPASLDPLSKSFFADRWLSQSCILPVRGIRLLPESRLGFNAKVEALTGRRLSNAAFDKGDPYLPLDFSHAPKLELIIASYLDIKADFSGTVFVRMLRYHARRGTPIRIITTEILEREKDRAPLEKLAADYPNVQLQEFIWDPPRGSDIEDEAARYHRTSHVKMLVTLSRRRGETRAIVGGRNIHDGFLFPEAVDLSAYPELQNYEGPGKLSLNYFATYHDFEAELTDERTVRTLAAHLSTLWNRDADTSAFRPFSVSVEKRGMPLTGMRHFMSSPYEDSNALENWYVELIDAARHSIEIVTPYLNPPAPVAAALERAHDRGVHITIAARVNLKGDLGGQILTRLNQLFVEKYAGTYEMYEFKAPKVVLHSKIVMIDGRLSILGSVNLNHRSFLLDSENGLAVLDKSFYRRMKKVFDDYVADSVRLTPDVDIPASYRLLLSSQLLLNAL